MMNQKPLSFQADIRKHIALEYLMYIPENYSDSEEVWPLVLFLHGMGERGSDLNLVKVHGLPKMIEAGSDFPFLVVSPQCPENTIWANETEALHALIEDLIGTYRVDRSRIYLTGLSMGGNGTWQLAVAYPSIFAAIVPICGWTNHFLGFPEKIRVLRNLPIWAFHGAKDKVVLLQQSQELVDELKKQRGNVKFTIYPDAAHDSWTKTYKNPALYEWLLSQKNNSFEISNTLIGQH